MILRTYACEACNHMLTMELRSDQWDQAPPECPKCAVQPMGQEFFPPAIGGSVQGRAAAIALEIAEHDYGVSNLQLDNREGGVAKVTYKDATPNLPSSTWSANQETLESAIAVGRESRRRYGNGLDVLQSALQTGAQPDLIELSKRRSIRVG